MWEACLTSYGSPQPLTVIDLPFFTLMFFFNWVKLGCSVVLGYIIGLAVIWDRRLCPKESICVFCFPCGGACVLASKLVSLSS
jgi:hypothetical protein